MSRGQSTFIDQGPPSTSVTLLQRLSGGGDEQDWRRFVDLYSPFLYRWVSSAGLQDSDARDAVQEILLTVMAKLPTFRYDPNGTFRGWLRTIAMNAARLHFRKRQVTGRGTGDGGLSGVMSEESLSAFWDGEYATHVVARALQTMQAEF
ncbi:MAG: sigma-70 family RNA polymerase sigma factor, partial [Planctomycetaceae bacterium]|nr:sigma-70 family RNA polymerase sigma factor [Planctomycetaceae bacterium]